MTRSLIRPSSHLHLWRGLTTACCRPCVSFARRYGSRLAKRVLPPLPHLPTCLHDALLRRTQTHCPLSFNCRPQKNLTADNASAAAAAAPHYRIRQPIAILEKPSCSHLTDQGPSHAAFLSSGINSAYASDQSPQQSERAAYSGYLSATAPPTDRLAAVHALDPNVVALWLSYQEAGTPRIPGALPFLRSRDSRTTMVHLPMS
ncbi:hypothetical protein BS50DRAFT_305393 [Corynespora cassiicola Philippines]|uniref:Uncharacterized protein n=1 Tax=Corynespora cassiicola Philippines TaxID=1448308 RepID=A0A2T2NXF7_CORCC|nr:hypothetical protein BS50DRAFT_305393 [Corynespora cassiicola Philippines]